MQPKHRSAAIEGQIRDVERFKDTDRMADVILVMEIDLERTKKLT